MLIVPPPGIVTDAVPELRVAVTPAPIKLNDVAFPNIVPSSCTCDCPPAEFILLLTLALNAPKLPVNCVNDALPVTFKLPVISTPYLNVDFFQCSAVPFDVHIIAESLPSGLLPFAIIIGTVVPPYCGEYEVATAPKNVAPTAFPNSVVTVHPPNMSPG